MIALQLTFTAHEARLAARPAHRAVLEQLHADGKLLGAGPWDDDSGALLIFDLARPAVDEVISGDPYYTKPGVTVESIRTWTPIVGPN